MSRIFTLGVIGLERSVREGIRDFYLSRLRKMGAGWVGG